MDWVFVFTQYFQYLPLPVTLKFDRHCKLFAQGKGRLKTTYAPLSKKGNTVFSLAYRKKNISIAERMQPFIPPCLFLGTRPFWPPSLRTGCLRSQKGVNGYG